MSCTDWHKTISQSKCIKSELVCFGHPGHPNDRNGPTLGPLRLALLNFLNGSKMVNF